MTDTPSSPLSAFGLKGRRILITQLLMELCDSDASKLFAATYDIPEKDVEVAITGLAQYFDDHPLDTLDTMDDD